MKAVVYALFGACLLVAGTALAATPEPVAAEGAAAQLDVAKQAKRRAYQETGEERRRLLSECMAEYRVVLEEYGDDGASCAEASFRIGEIERTLGNQDAARRAFEDSARRGAGEVAPRFAARALNEVAHLDRRAERFDQAVAGYRRVLSEFPSEDREGSKALTWIGKVENKRGNVTKAREAWLSVAERFPSQPVSGIRAADLAAMSALEGGDADEARRILEATRNRFAPTDGEPHPYWTPDVDQALEKMRTARKLAENT